MNRTDLEFALERLGARCPPGSEIMLAGGSALILGGYINRGTSDGDVIHADPRLAELRSHIAAVAEELDLPPGWLNDGVKAWAGVLPPDFRNRLEDVGTFGNLRVRRLGRLDLLVMKFFSLRAVDLDDLDELGPTAEEVAFVRGQMERISTLFPDGALRVSLYLDQGEPMDLTDSRSPH